MRLSDISEKPDADLTAFVSFALSQETKQSLTGLARAKRRSLSDVVREIVETFVSTNKEELNKL